MKLFVNIITWTVVTLVVLVSVVLVLSKLNTPFKLRLFSITSGSMEPGIPTGSLVVTWPQADYSVGDTVTVKAERGIKGLVTHRINQVLPMGDDGLTYYELKGDANDNPDSELINKDRVIGKVRFHVPYLGQLVGFTQTQTGFILLVVMPGTLIVYNELMTIKEEIMKFKRGSKESQTEHHKAEGETLLTL